MTTQNEMDLKQYKTIETRFYGELTKTVRRYTSDLSLISILGILEIVKEETRDLDKTGRLISKRGIPSDDGGKKDLDSIM